MNMSKYPANPRKSSSRTQGGQVTLKRKGTAKYGSGHLRAIPKRAEKVSPRVLQYSHRQAISSRPKTKLEVKKSGVRIQGDSSKISPAVKKRRVLDDVHRSSTGKVSNPESSMQWPIQSRPTLNERLDRIEQMLPKLDSMLSIIKAWFEAEAKRKVEILGGVSSAKGSEVRGSGEKGTVVGPFDDSRKRKRDSTESRSEWSLIFCGICMDGKTPPEMFKSGGACPHSFCRTCIGSHVAAKIRDNVAKVKCPDPACEALLEPRNCGSVVPRGVLDRWEVVICESLLGSKKFYCPFKDCSALMIDDGDQAVTSAECPYCHRLFCARCRVPWHSGSRCDNKTKFVDRSDKKFLELAKKEKWQKCPSCKFHVQRTDGCESIKCRCGYKFCYICGSGWRFGHLCAT